MTGGLRTVSIFGVTGSVGQSSCDVIKAHPDMFKVQAVTAHKNVQKLAAQAIALNAARAVIGDQTLYQELKAALAGHDIEAAAGQEAICEAAALPADIVMAAIVGMAGLKPLMAAIAQGNVVAIANKEPLVSAGSLVMEAAKQSGATLLPVDSEHNAIFQVFEASQKQAVKRIILTASGGPFRTLSIEEMSRATKAQALAHPNWSMGQKISIDSATMMNKALEVIEASVLFEMPPGKIDVLIHPESLIHSMVEYADGSILAQLGAADMRTPITNVLGWPERIATPGETLDFTKISQMNFEAVDSRRFPAIALAYEALEQGLAARIALNAANEIAVQAFLDGHIGFLDIVETVRHILNTDHGDDPQTLDDVLMYDEQMRNRVQSDILKDSKRPNLERKKVS